MEKINVAQLLKNCPQGMELDCTMVDDVTFYGIGNEETIVVKRELVNQKLYLDRYGAPFVFPKKDLKCVIFPKGKTSWEGFVPPCKFNDGDIISTLCASGNIWISIFKKKGSFGEVETYVDYYYNTKNNNLDYCCINTYGQSLCTEKDIAAQRLATEEEREKLLKAIEGKGYRWNSENKTLERFIKPKFKVGDKVKRKDVNYTYIITIAKLGGDYYDYVNEDGQCGVIHISKQDDWELVPNKFDINTLKPFESRVLVRLTKDNVWNAAFFSHYDKEVKWGCYPFVTTSSKSYLMCIPYEGNEYLLGKTDDCSEFYKNW